MPSTIKSLISNTSFLCEIKEGNSCSICFLYPYCFSLIVALFKFRNPLAVRWLVVPIVVNSLNAMFFVAVSHISKKTNKTINPTITYCNSSASVIRIGSTRWIKASLFHIAPRNVFTSSRMIRSIRSAITMLNLSNQYLMLQTTAASCGMAIKRPTTDQLCISTITQAIPHGLSSATPCSANDYKPANSFSSHVDEFHGSIVSRTGPQFR